MQFSALKQELSDRGYDDLSDTRQRDVAIVGGCWVWQRQITDNGYGRACEGGEHILAHRLIYELLVGPIPEGLDIDHLCRNRACVNPDHLEPVTRRENLRRGDGTRLSADDVAAIRSRLPRMPGSLRARARTLAGEYGVSFETIRAIHYGRSWRDL